MTIKYKSLTFQYILFLEGDSSNYLTYFKRATVLMAMGRSRSALPDLDEAIKLNPKFLQVENLDQKGFNQEG